MNETTISTFPGDFRIHVGIPVADLERSIEFYQLLFQLAPSKTKPGYAKFEPQDPSVNFTLNQSNTEDDLRLPGQHFGIQVKSTSAVSDAIKRFEAAGLKMKVQDKETCCFAVQDKVWVQDPDQNLWEVFCVLQDAESPNGHSSCCLPVENSDDSKVAVKCC